MAYYTFDTSVVISKKVQTLPDNFLFSAVVLLELIASAKDESERKKYETLARDYRIDNSIIVPDFDDWLLASKILHCFFHNVKEKQGTKRPHSKLKQPKEWILKQ